MDDVWIPLVDEPIGGIVREIEDSDPSIRALVDSPPKLLPVRPFPSIRVGLVLGQLLVDHDLEPYDGTETWIEQMMREPAHSAHVRAEGRAVAEEVAAGPRYEGDDHLGPDDDARARFREFAKKQLGTE